ncbi:MAG: ATP-binding protein [Candidatus Kapabacteria bacterium]|nr:ATP-binding protein [Candidatus Kapabacteria bacterium]
MTPFSNHSERLQIVASTKSLQSVREFIASVVSGHGFTDFEENGIVLAVDEACANLITHAFQHDPSQVIEIVVAIDHKQIQVEISDSARPFDPKSVAQPNMDDYLRERRVGGLGISLMRRVMDDIRYVPASPGQPRNTLFLTKRRTA